MKRLKKFVKIRYFWWFSLLLILFFLFIPALEIKFWWVDDGSSILISQQIINALKNLDFKGLNLIFFEGSGRFRVIYWLYQTFVYLVGGTNPLIHFSIHFLVIYATSILIFETVRVITKSNFAGYFSGALYVLSPVNNENIYRLGPVETILAFFGAASLYYLFKNKLSLSIFFLFLASFSKELGFILWLPILLAYLLKRTIYKQRNINFEKYCVWGISFLFLVIISTIFRRSGYSTYYVVDIPKLVQHFTSYLALAYKSFAPFFGIFIVTFLIRFLWFIKDEKIKRVGLSFLEQGIFITLFITFVLVQSPWKYLLERYLMPATVGLVIFLGIEFEEIRKILTRQRVYIRTLVSWVFIIYFAVMILSNSLRIYKQGERVSFSTNFIQYLYSYLSQNITKDGTVLLNFVKGDSTIELVHETDRHLELLYGRKDINVDYLDLGKLPDRPFVIVGTPMIGEEYPREVIENSIRNYQSDNGLVWEKRLLIITTPPNLIKQVIKKSIGLIIFKKPFTSDGIYTFYILRDYWYKYNVEK